MKTQQHTPGPWMVQANQNNLPVHVMGADGAFVANCNDAPIGEAEANARLIASAPALLEALKDLLEWANIKDGSPSQYLRDKAKAAIQAAEGRG